ncbi:MAG: HD domain-containing protein [Patescibacteria group bacterium]
MGFEKQYKETIELLEQIITEPNNKEKQIIPHCLRVGNYLYSNNYSQDVIIAGLLHDAIEWGPTSKEKLALKYNNHILAIVIANTKDKTIKDQQERRKDYIKRCAMVGIDALIVKAADMLDSYSFYTNNNNTKEIERCEDIARLLIMHWPEENNDMIIQEVKKVLK